MSMDEFPKYWPQVSEYLLEHDQAKVKDLRKLFRRPQEWIYKLMNTARGKEYVEVYKEAGRNVYRLTPSYKAKLAKIKAEQEPPKEGKIVSLKGTAKITPKAKELIKEEMEDVKKVEDVKELITKQSKKEVEIELTSEGQQAIQQLAEKKALEKFKKEFMANQIHLMIHLKCGNQKFYISGKSEIYRMSEFRKIREKLQGILDEMVDGGKVINQE